MSSKINKSHKVNSKKQTLNKKNKIGIDKIPFK